MGDEVGGPCYYRLDLESRAVFEASNPCCTRSAEQRPTQVICPAREAFKEFDEEISSKSPSDAGLLTAPLMAGLIVASVIGGRLVSALGRYKALSVLGLGLAIAGFIAIAAAVRAAAPLPAIELTT